MTAPVNAQVAVNFKANGVGEVQRGLKLVGSTAETTSRQVGGAMRQIAGGVEQIARQGKVTGEAMKNIISQGAEMAFMFGTAGPIVGAIAIVGVAIYEHITGRMKEAREEINKTRREMEDLSSGDLASAGRAQQRRYSGNPNAVRLEGESAAAYHARRYGIEGVRARIDQLRGTLPADVVARAGEGKLPLGLVATTVSEGSKELIELIKQLARLKVELSQNEEITRKLADAEGERVKTANRLSDEAYLKGMPLSSAQIAAHGKMDSLLDPILARGLPGVQGMKLGGTLTTTRLPGLEGLKPKDLGDQFKNVFVNPLAESITKTIGDGIGGAISAGFDAAFAKGANFGKVAAAFGASALSTVGAVFKDIGMQTLIGLKFMAAIKASIETWNPAFGVAASIGLIALGSALQSAGGRMASNASGGGFGGGGGGSSSSPSTIIDRGFIDPTRSATAAGNVSMRNMIVLAPTVIGVDSPTAQRGILELIRNAERRGSIGNV